MIVLKAIGLVLLVASIALILAFIHAIYRLAVMAQVPHPKRLAAGVLVAVSPSIGFTLHGVWKLLQH